MAEKDKKTDLTEIEEGIAEEKGEPKGTTVIHDIKEALANWPIKKASAFLLKNSDPDEVQKTIKKLKKKHKGLRSKLSDLEAEINSFDESTASEKEKKQHEKRKEKRDKILKAKGKTETERTSKEEEMRKAKILKEIREKNETVRQRFLAEQKRKEKLMGIYSSLPGTSYDFAQHFNDDVVEPTNTFLTDEATLESKNLTELGTYLTTSHKTLLTAINRNIEAIHNELDPALKEAKRLLEEKFTANRELIDFFIQNYSDELAEKFPEITRIIYLIYKFDNSTTVSGLIDDKITDLDTSFKDVFVTGTAKKPDLKEMIKKAKQFKNITEDIPKFIDKLEPERQKLLDKMDNLKADKKTYPKAGEFLDKWEAVGGGENLDQFKLSDVKRWHELLDPSYFEGTNYDNIRKDAKECWDRLDAKENLEKVLEFFDILSESFESDYAIASQMERDHYKLLSGPDKEKAEALAKNVFALCKAKITDPEELKKIEEKIYKPSVRGGAPKLAMNHANTLRYLLDEVIPDLEEKVGPSVVDIATGSEKGDLEYLKSLEKSLSKRIDARLKEEEGKFSKSNFKVKIKDEHGTTSSMSIKEIETKISEIDQQIEIFKTNKANAENEITLQEGKLKQANFEIDDLKEKNNSLEDKILMIQGNANLSKTERDAQCTSIRAKIRENENKIATKRTDAANILQELEAQRKIIEKSNTSINKKTTYKIRLNHGLKQYEDKEDKLKVIRKDLEKSTDPDLMIDVEGVGKLNFNDLHAKIEANEMNVDVKAAGRERHENALKNLGEYKKSLADIYDKNYQETDDKLTGLHDQYSDLEIRLQEAVNLRSNEDPQELEAELNQVMEDINLVRKNDLVGFSQNELKKRKEERKKKAGETSEKIFNLMQNFKGSKTELDTYYKLFEPVIQNVYNDVLITDQEAAGNLLVLVERGPGSVRKWAGLDVKATAIRGFRFFSGRRRQFVRENKMKEKARNGHTKNWWRKYRQIQMDSLTDGQKVQKEIIAEQERRIKALELKKSHLEAKGKEKRVEKIAKKIENIQYKNQKREMFMEQHDRRIEKLKGLEKKRAIFGTGIKAIKGVRKSKRAQERTGYMPGADVVSLAEKRKAKKESEKADEGAKAA